MRSEPPNAFQMCSVTKTQTIFPFVEYIEDTGLGHAGESGSTSWNLATLDLPLCVVSCSFSIGSETPLS